MIGECLSMMELYEQMNTMESDVFGFEQWSFRRRVVSVQLSVVVDGDVDVDNVEHVRNR